MCVALLPCGERGRLRGSGGRAALSICTPSKFLSGPLQSSSVTKHTSNKKMPSSFKKFLRNIFLKVCLHLIFSRLCSLVPTEPGPGWARRASPPHTHREGRQEDHGALLEALSLASPRCMPSWRSCTQDSKAGEQ